MQTQRKRGWQHYYDAEWNSGQKQEVSNFRLIKKKILQNEIINSKQISGCWGSVVEWGEWSHYHDKTLWITWSTKQNPEKQKLPIYKSKIQFFLGFSSTYTQERKEEGWGEKIYGQWRSPQHCLDTLFTIENYQKQPKRLHNWRLIR